MSLLCAIVGCLIFPCLLMNKIQGFSGSFWDALTELDFFFHYYLCVIFDGIIALSYHNSTPELH